MDGGINAEDAGFRKKARLREEACLPVCTDASIKIDYKDPKLLKHFVTERGKIMPRRMTGTCANHQRKLREEIKKARHIALLPFTTVTR